VAVATYAHEMHATTQGSERWKRARKRWQLAMLELADRWEARTLPRTEEGVDDETL
jgi:hypothetical protein